MHLKIFSGCLFITQYQPLLGLYFLNIPIRCQHIPQSLDTLVSTCLIGIQNTTLPQNTSVGFECETISEFSHSASRSYHAGSRDPKKRSWTAYFRKGAATATNFLLPTRCMQTIQPLILATGFDCPNTVVSCAGRRCARWKDAKSVFHR